MEQTEICSNCRKEIPASKSATHFGYCRRNILKCATCGQMYDKNFLEDHEEQFHSNSKCSHCDKMFRKNQVTAHGSICDLRPKHCEYCDLNVPVKDFNVHFKQCEARTSVCEVCSKSVPNKEFAVHTLTCREKPKQANKGRDEWREPSMYNFQDSLSEFYQQGDREKEKKTGKKETDSPVRRNQVKKEVSKGGKSEKQEKPSFKKKEADPKSLSRQHFYDNYINSSPNRFEEYDFQDGFQQNYGQIHFNDEDNYAYLPQESFYGKRLFDFPSTSSLNYPDKDIDDISPQQQLLQETLFESSKNKGPSAKFKDSLPQDFFSKDIMNGSFYGDILDFQKQKAILDDLGKNKPKKAEPKVEIKAVKPVTKSYIQHNKKR